MKIQTNIMSMRVLNQYNTNYKGLQKASEKMASGYRINKAGDDPRGLAISEKMRSQISGLKRASRNTSDAISFIQTAEGALQEVHSMLQRMNELTVQASTGTMSMADRDQLAKEFNQLKNEIDDISNQTSFNGVKVLDGSLASTSYVASASAAGINAASMTLAELSINMTDSYTGTAIDEAYASFTVDFSKLTDGDVIDFTAGGATVASLSFDSATMLSIADVMSAIESSLDPNFTAASLGDSITFTAVTPGFLGNWSANVSPSTGSPAATVVDLDISKLVSGDKLTLNGNTAEWDNGMSLNDFIDQLGLNPADYELAGNTLTLFSAYTQADIENAFEPGYRVTSGGIRVQIGALKNELLITEIKSMSTDGLGISGVDIDSQENASRATTAVAYAIDLVSNQRAVLGAVQNRLEYKERSLDTSAVKLHEAESRIRDVDIADEMTTYTKNGLLLQASTEIMKRVNERPKYVLNLLQ